MPAAYLADRLRDPRGGALVGSFIKLPRFEVVDLLAQAGFDFGVCDYEHAQMSLSEACDVVRAGAARAFPITVRVPGLDRGDVNRLLEAGAAGIQLARVAADSALSLGDLVRYPPLGSRSVSLAQPVAQYGAVPLTEHLASSNANVLTIGQFETADYADDIETAMSALDVAFIGPVDLSVDLGTPGDLGSEPMSDAITAIESAAAAAGTPMGTFAGSPAAVADARARGYRYIVFSSDLNMLSAGAAQLTPR